jgi:RNA polymerase sigma-70 factor (ECF subfamily)
MPSASIMPEHRPSEDDVFRTTRWSLVQRAAGAALGAGMTLRGEALSELLRRYLPAMRSHLLARMRIPCDRVDDLLQGFIVRKILEYDLLARADQSRGKFRTLLLTSLDNYVRNELAKRSARDNAEAVSEDLPSESQHQPGRDFDVPWARALLGQAIERMHQECIRSARADVWGVFDARILGPTLRDQPPMEYAQLVQRFKLKSPAHASNVLITAKRMFERTLRSLVAEYAEDESDVEAEIADLREVLSRALA